MSVLVLGVTGVLDRARTRLMSVLVLGVSEVLDHEVNEDPHDDGSVGSSHVKIFQVFVRLEPWNVEELNDNESPDVC